MDKILEIRSAMANHSDVGTLRRQFLSELGLLAANLVLPSKDWAGQSPSTNTRWIDFHSHFSPPTWVKAFEAKTRQGLFKDNFLHVRGVENNNALQPAKDWAPAKLIEAMDGAAVATSIVSITWPGIWFGEKQDPPEAVRRLARESNDYGARLMSDHPGRIGLFAVLPLPDIEGSLREIQYALDTLKATGVGVLTSYGDKWFGDSAFAPVFEELNRRKAVVFTHPRLDGLYGPAYADTNRTIMSLLQTGAATRYADIRYIFAHAGGTIPYRIGSFLGHANTAKTLASPAAPNTPLFELRHFHYDTAQSANPATMAGLKKVIPVSQILFGTDYPNSSDQGQNSIAETRQNLEECGEFNSEELRAIGRENALKLLPKYKT